VVVPCDYHVTFRERFTKSICKNSINCQSFEKFRREGEEREGAKGGKVGRREGRGRRRGEEERNRTQKNAGCTYDCHGDIV